MDALARNSCEDSKHFRPSLNIRALEVDVSRCSPLSRPGWPGNALRFSFINLCRTLQVLPSSVDVVQLSSSKCLQGFESGLLNDYVLRCEAFTICGIRPPDGLGCHFPGHTQSRCQNPWWIFERALASIPLFGWLQSCHVGRLTARHGAFAPLT